MAWQIEGKEAVLAWLERESDPAVREHVLAWLPQWAEDPESYAFMPVPSNEAPVYVTFVPGTTVGVKFLAATQFRVLKILKMKTVQNL